MNGSANGITYVRGDATSPHGKGAKVIAHVRNDLGGWGKGFGPGAARFVRVEPLVLRRLVDRGIPVTVYDFGA
nr:MULTISPECIES: hypothetical protein [unclassified Streptomyces]